MQKINDKLPIETWKEIAYHVQRLKFSDGGEEEFKQNLQKLKKLLVNLDLELIEGSREPSKEEEIGLSTLIKSIYDLGRYNRAIFYEQIYTLLELGVQKIEFCPTNFITSIENYQKYFVDQKLTIYQMTYTDGLFELNKSKEVRERSHLLEEIIKYNYNIVNLHDANFILTVWLQKMHNLEGKESVEFQTASASLKNFDGKFPSKKEIMMDRFPNLIVPKQEIDFGEEVHNLQEKFEFFSEELSCDKRLTRDKNGEWYYKKEPKN